MEDIEQDDAELLSQTDYPLDFLYQKWLRTEDGLQAEFHSCIKERVTEERILERDRLVGALKVKIDREFAEFKQTLTNKTPGEIIGVSDEIFAKSFIRNMFTSEKVENTLDGFEVCDIRTLVGCQNTLETIYINMWKFPSEEEEFNRYLYGRLRISMGAISYSTDEDDEDF